MSGIKPVIREVREAVLTGFAHSKDKLHQVTDNMNGHLDDIARGVRDKDKFDNPDGNSTPGDTNIPGDGTNNRGPVTEFETGSFRDLQRRERVGDAMQHDHIPSSAAIRRARENELGHALTRTERRQLHNEAVAVELSDLLHSLSRTFGGRNTQTQINLDASDLRVAMERDLKTLRQNLTSDGRLSPSEIDRLLNEIRDLNRRRGIG